MIVTEISYSKVFSLGNFENEKIGILASVDDEDDIGEVFDELVKSVEAQHRKTQEKKERQNETLNRIYDAKNLLAAAGYDVSDNPVREPQEELPF